MLSTLQINIPLAPDFYETNPLVVEAKDLTLLISKSTPGYDPESYPQNIYPKIQLNVILPTPPQSSSIHFLSEFPHQNSALIPSTPSELHVLDFTNLAILGDLYR
jgi:hypothetical protein